MWRARKEPVMAQTQNIRTSKSSPRKRGHVGRGYRISRALFQMHPAPSLPEDNAPSFEPPKWLSFSISCVALPVLRSVIGLACTHMITFVDTSTFQSGLSALEHLNGVVQPMLQLPFAIRVFIIVWNIVKAVMKK